MSKYVTRKPDISHTNVGRDQYRKVRPSQKSVFRQLAVELARNYSRAYYFKFGRYNVFFETKLGFY